jgi:hypothetical protein
LTAPWRAAKVAEAMKRLDFPRKTRAYFDLHAKLDALHAREWIQEIIRPLVTKNPNCAQFIAEGALMRLQCGQRCFDRYSSKNGTEPTWVKPKTEEISCTDYSTKIVANGVLYNNVWNKSAAKSFQWKQCIEKSVTHELYGWSWLWPEKSKSIFGYVDIQK